MNSTNTSNRSSGDLKISGVTKSYGNTRALDPVDIEVRRGECLSLLGPSGSGKTTLLKLIAGFESPDAGSITLGGEDLTKLPPAKRGIGMVFQNYSLFPHMTVMKNIEYGLRMRGVSAQKRRESASKVLEMVRLEALGSRMPTQLSGGQQQRVALARALAFEPQLVLMDEPLGALDRSLRREMEEEIRRIQRSSGVTMIYVTHDHEEALKLSDRIALLRNGSIAACGSPQELFDTPRTAFTANFLGGSNFLNGAIRRVEAGWAVIQIGDEVIKLKSDSNLPANPILMFRPSATRFLVGSNETVQLRIRVRDCLYLGDDLQLSGYQVSDQDQKNLLRIRLDPRTAPDLKSGSVFNASLPGSALSIVQDDL